MKTFSASGRFNSSCSNVLLGINHRSVVTSCNSAAPHHLCSQQKLSRVFARDRCEDGSDHTFHNIPKLETTQVAVTNAVGKVTLLNGSWIWQHPVYTVEGYRKERDFKGRTRKSLKRIISGEVASVWGHKGFSRWITSSFFGRWRSPMWPMTLLVLTRKFLTDRLKVTFLGNWNCS